MLNVAQRMLFVFVDGELVRAFPAAVGKPDWATPVGRFSVLIKEIEPVWDVPVSIQQEMAVRGGRFSPQYHLDPTTLSATGGWR